MTYQAVRQSIILIIIFSLVSFPAISIGSAPPQVTLVSPANNSVSVNQNVTFQCSATDDVGLMNASLYYGKQLQTTKTFREDGTYVNQTDDTQISADNPNTNYGTLTEMNVDGQTPHAHGLIKFPNIFGSNPEQILLGANITSASLTLNCFNPGNTPKAYLLKEDWIESQATWNQRTSGTPWSNLGADGPLSHESTAIDFVCSSIGIKTYDITSIIQQWSNGTPNYGIVVKDTGIDGIDYYTSKNPTTTNRPLLSVSYNYLENWGIKNTKAVSGTSASAQFTATLDDFSQYKWNCEFEDTEGQRSLASSNNTIEINSNYIPPYSTTPNLKVAFIGDQGLTTNSRAVLQLIKNEGAHMALHQGDFDYADSPALWDQQINDILGPNYPYFASIGNHDIAQWAGYQTKLQERLSRITGASCTGNLGVKSACQYQGLYFLLTAPGTMDTGHDIYIRDQLASNNAAWSICSWHKNMQAMDLGNSHPDETGWGVYEECRKGGGIVATAHDHVYGRTHLLSNFQTQTIDSTSATLILQKGKTFAFLSGLGGHSIYAQASSDPWFASAYTSTQNATYGALFCTFNVNSQPDRASCYFKNINNQIIDQFELISQVEILNQPPVANAGPDQTLSDSDNNGSEFVLLDGTTSYDPNGTIVSYAWKEGLTLLSSNATTTQNFLIGNHIITLTVTDNDSNTSSDTVNINVLANQPPTANAGPDQTIMDSDNNGFETVALNGTASQDPDGTITSFLWKEGETILSSLSTFTTNYGIGIHTLSLTVTDNGGATHTDFVTITINPKSNIPPQANAGPDQTANDSDGNGFETFTLNASLSYDSDGTIVFYAWKEGGVTFATGSVVVWSFATGVHTIELQVTDNEGAIGTDTAIVTVNPNQPPVANAGPDQTVTEDTLVNFDGSASRDLDGSIVSYVWNFGDGSADSTGATASHTYIDPGLYTVTLTVADNAGAIGQDTATVTVNPLMAEFTKRFSENGTFANTTNDAYISESSPTKNFGARTSMKVDGLDPHAHAFVQYPNIFGSRSDQIPLGATMVSAILTLNCTNAGNNMKAYTLLEDWIESQVTWRQRKTGVPWSNLGADGPLSHGTTALDFLCTTTGVKNYNITSFVQNWSSGAPNFGIVIIETGNDGIDFSTSEHSTLSFRPVLTVTYRVKAM